MISAISTMSQPEPATAAAVQSPVPAASTQSTSQSTSHPPANGVTDTVSISSAAQAILKEVKETPAQTAQEARGGDLQAQRLLAKEEASQPNAAGR